MVPRFFRCYYTFSRDFQSPNNIPTYSPCVRYAHVMEDVLQVLDGAGCWEADAVVSSLKGARLKFPDILKNALNLIAQHL